MLKKFSVAAVIGCSVLLGGCAQLNAITGEQQSTADLAGKIQAGKTTRSEVISMLGNPETDNLIDGNELLTYSLSNTFGKASSAGSVASSVLSYIPGLSSVSGYTAQATSAAGRMSKTQYIHITLKANIVQSVNITES